MSALQPATRTRRAPLSVRLNDQEFDLLRQRAGDLPLSTFLKQTALGDDAPPVRRRARPTPDQRLLALVLAALGQSRLASNLNQLAKAANSGSLPVSAETEAQLCQACRDVWLIRKALLMALSVETDHASAPDLDSACEPQRLATAFSNAGGGQP